MSILIGVLVVAGVGVVLMSMLGGKSGEKKKEAASSVGSSVNVAQIEKVIAKVSADKSKSSAASVGPVAVSTHQLNLKQVFVGRKAVIAEIAGKYFKDGVVLLGIHGESGMGKTSLASQIAGKMATHYPNAHLFVDLKTTSKNPVSTSEAMAQVIWSIRPAAKLPNSPDDLAAMYLSVLRDQRAILLLDNADTAKAKALIPPKSCLMLVVSRAPLSIPGLYNRKVDVLSLEESYELIKELAPRAVQHANEIIRHCDNLPLAITIVGKFLGKAPNLDIENFVDRMGALREKQKEAGVRKEQLGLSVALAHITKFLPEDTVAVWGRTLAFPGTFGSKAAAHVCGDEKNTNLFHLVTNGLVMHNPASDRYFLHEMVREYLGNNSNKVELTAALARHASYFLTIVSAANDMYGQGDDGLKKALALLDSEWGNIQAGFAWAENLTGKDGTATKLCSSYVETGYDLFKMRLRSAARLKWLEAALKASRSLQDKEAEMSHLMNLGLEHSGKNSHPSAIENFQQALELAKTLNDKSDEGAALRHLGLSHSALGDAVRALECHQRELDLAASRGDKTAEAKALSSMGHAHKKAGNLPQAVEFFQRWLTVARESEDKRAEGQALRVLADTQMAMGVETASILELYMQALGIFNSAKDRFGEALTLKGIAHAHLKGNSYQSAREFFEKARVIFNKGRDARNEGLVLQGLGMVCEAENKLPQAIEFFGKALKMFQATMDKEDQIAALDRLAKAYMGSGGADKAVKAYGQGAALAKEIADRRLEGRLLWEMSQAADIIGDRPKAIQQAELALKLFEATQDPDRENIKKKIEEWNAPTPLSG